MVPPILRSTPLVEAPGHNSVAKAPNNVDDVTAYHARVVPFVGPGDRQTFIDRLHWNHDRMYLAPPSLGMQPVPDRPLVADRFDRGNGALGDGWDVEGASWRVANGEARGSAGNALLTTDPLHHYVFEANVRLADAASGAAGVVAHAAGADRVRVWLDADRRALVVGGGGVPETVTALPEDVRFDVYHQILVTKNAVRLRVALDGVTRQTHDLDLGAGRVGLWVGEGEARFDGVALTPFFEDAFDAPDATWDVQAGTWLVDEGALHQSAGGAGRHVALKGDPAEDYEFTASVRFRDQESTASTAGVVAAATEAGKMVTVGFDRTIWPFARLWVRHLDDGGVQEAFSVGLPRGFRYEEPHTLRVVKEGERFTVFLDGQEVASARFAVGIARPGLYTEGVRAAFDDARMKRVVVPGNLVLDGSFEALPWEDVDGEPAAPWRFTDGASVNTCCSYDGLQRLRIAGDGEAEQVVQGLAPGRYTLYAQALSRGGEAVVRVAPAGGAVREGTAAGEAWHPVAVDFEVPAGHDSATLTLSGRLRGDGSYAAIDNVYLVRR